MKITKFKKSSGSKYILELENGKSLLLYEDTLIKYNLLYSKDIDISILNELLEYNDYASCYNDALKYISKKMHAIKEVKEYLLKREYNENIIQECISRLISNKLINEEQYAKAYVNDRFYLSKDGPYKIIRDLENLDIDSNIINNSIKCISLSEVEEKIKKYINKKKNNNSKYSNNMLNKKITDELINLGYDIEIINKYLSFDDSDREIIKKEYSKALKKYSLKYSGYELNMKIKSYLYSKGYKIDDINNII